jgi:hypothetical protein
MEVMHLLPLEQIQQEADHQGEGKTHHRQG